jgi:hypothetical protein
VLAAQQRTLTSALNNSFHLCKTCLDVVISALIGLSKCPVKPGENQCWPPGGPQAALCFAIGLSGPLFGFPGGRDGRKPMLKFYIGRYRYDTDLTGSDISVTY